MNKQEWQPAPAIALGLLISASLLALSYGSIEAHYAHELQDRAETLWALSGERLRLADERIDLADERLALGQRASAPSVRDRTKADWEAILGGTREIVDSTVFAEGRFWCVDKAEGGEVVWSEPAGLPPDHGAPSPITLPPGVVWVSNVEVVDLGREDGVALRRIP